MSKKIETYSEFLKITKKRIEGETEKLNDCWIWNGSKTRDGYGIIQFFKKKYRVHRLAYIIYKGVIPLKKLVCHKCDNPSCVNPDHLFLGTHQENSLDMIRKNRQKSGENTKASKLKERDILKIRQMADYVPDYEIALEFGISNEHVQNIINYKSWKHLR